MSSPFFFKIAPESAETQNRTKIINAFPADEQEQARTMLSESLQAVVAQQLLRTKDGHGRCAANEILIGSSALASTIREGKISQINSLIQTGSSSGMQSMDQHLLQLIKEDEITAEAAYEKGIDKKLFEPLISREGTPSQDSPASSNQIN